MFGGGSGGVVPTPTRGGSRGRDHGGCAGGSNVEVIPEAWRDTGCGRDKAGDEIGIGTGAGPETGAAGAGLAGGTRECCNGCGMAVGIDVDFNVSVSVG